MQDLILIFMFYIYETSINILKKIINQGNMTVCSCDVTYAF